MVVFYVCNGENENCKKNGCYKNGGECHHTTNIEYAKNFTSESQHKGISNIYKGEIWEKLSKEDE